METLPLTPPPLVSLPGGVPHLTIRIVQIILQIDRVDSHGKMDADLPWRSVPASSDLYLIKYDMHCLMAMRTDPSDGRKLTSNAGHRAGHTSSDLVRLEFSAEFRGTVVLYSDDSKDGARVVSWPGFDGALDMDRDTRWGRRGAKPR
ncbi:hypothetical protein PPROV_001090600 [Pycnococcus provasolii]|uniref:Uncharacterized protein n=1 Tax=Pycnococcus provasolii TaxID=41880 RepID=A0A830HYU0_9CHLO|nr:hypothetical protein PPROV_001090600 [Pycnococcus provasolii]